MLSEDLGDTLTSAFEVQRAAFALDSNPPLAARLDRLTRMKRLLEENEAALAREVSADFGNRSLHETAIGETALVLLAIAHTRRHLRRWMKTRRVATSVHSLPGRSSIMPQPLGVVGVVSPWNYPLQLALAPAVAALAAGNRVLIKPSEVTPRFASLLQALVARYFQREECAVVTGGVEIARSFVAMPFDHLFFTGSTAVGRQVATAAAANLTPVTLELGGKSPAIVDTSFDLQEAAQKIAAAKLFNAGQTCIAPDYVMVPAPRLDEFVAAYTQAVERMYPTLDGNPDYTSIVNDRHHERLAALTADAIAQGARVVSINPGGHAELQGARKMRPALVLGVTDAMALMQEEIFGPVLPVIPYDSPEQALAYVNARPRPLALYWFGKDRRRREQVLRRTVSGGVTINDALLHIAQENLPFGGVGASGSGAYHGEWGFGLFSKEKPVFDQSSFAGTALLRPPYGRTASFVLRMLRRIG